jgi:hypothetical protein
MHACITPTDFPTLLTLYRLVGPVARAANPKRVLCPTSGPQDIPHGAKEQNRIFLTLVDDRCQYCKCKQRQLTAEAANEVKILVDTVVYSKHVFPAKYASINDDHSSLCPQYSRELRQFGLPPVLAHWYTRIQAPRIFFKTLE